MVSVDSSIHVTILVHAFFSDIKEDRLFESKVIDVKELKGVLGSQCGYFRNISQRSATLPLQTQLLSGSKHHLLDFRSACDLRSHTAYTNFASFPVAGKCLHGNGIAKDGTCHGVFQRQYTHLRNYLGTS
jgi:hypothetical protein